MSSRLRVTMPRGAFALWVLADLGAVAQDPPVTAPTPPVRFERVLWVGDPAAQASRVAAAGYTAVQLGRGADPAVLAPHGLGFYLDQPIGKGVFELRDEDWRPLPQRYEATRDTSVLVRPGCFATPGLLARCCNDAAAELQRVAGPGLRFVALADEASATRHDAPLDTCQCEHCLAAFRRFVQRRLPTIDAANQALGVQVAAFDDLRPVTTDQVRRRDLSDPTLPASLQAFALQREFVDEQFADAVAAVVGAMRRVAPTVPIGLTGVQVPAAFGGNDPARVWPALGLAEPYDIGGTVELAASLLPSGAHRYTTLFPPGEDLAAKVALAPWVQASVARMAARGLAGVVVWNDATVLAPDGSATPFGAAVQAALRRFGPVLDACAGAELVPGPVWVLESQPSVRVWWLLDSARDGMTWVRRLSSYERTHSTSQAARLGWTRLLQDLGLQPHFVTEPTLPERLLRERPPCLVLPATIALGDRAVQAIGAYVRAGGTVLADHATALYDDRLVRRATGGLDELFGITRRSLRHDDLRVREGRVTASYTTALPAAELGLAGRLAERRGDAATFVEQRPGRGRAVYLNLPVVEYLHLRLDEGRVAAALDLRRAVRGVLQTAGAEPPCEVRGAGLPTCIERVPLRLRDGRSVLVVRVHALDQPALLTRLGQDGPRAIQAVFARPRRLRHLGGDDLPEQATFDLRLDPFGALWLEDRGP
jgi:hypothetical protein